MSVQFLSIFSFKNFEQNMGERNDPIAHSNKITEDAVTGVVSFRIMLGDCRLREINFVQLFSNVNTPGIDFC